MAISRPVWKGQLRFGLVGFGVALHAARDSTGRPGFRQIHRPTGLPVSHEKTVPGVGRVEEADIAKGVEIAKDTYVLIEDADLAAIALPSQDVVDLARFVEPDDIEALHYEKAYYVVPDGEAAMAPYLLLRDVLAGEDLVGIGRLTIRGRESVVAVRPYADGLLLETLHYPDEVRRPGPYFAEVAETEIPDEARALARDLVLRMRGPLELSDYRDGYREAVMRLVEAKVKNRRPTVVDIAERRRTAPGDLLEALRRSQRPVLEAADE